MPACVFVFVCVSGKERDGDRDRENISIENLRVMRGKGESNYFTKI